jgi:hypothetical protein
MVSNEHARCPLSFENYISSSAPIQRTYAPSPLLCVRPYRRLYPNISARFAGRAIYSIPHFNPPQMPPNDQRICQEHSPLECYKREKFVCAYVFCAYLGNSRFLQFGDLIRLCFESNRVPCSPWTPPRVFN